MQRRAVVADERFPVPEGPGSLVNTSGVTISSRRRWNSPSVRCDAIQGLELFPEVCFKRGAIADIRAIFVLEVP